MAAGTAAVLGTGAMGAPIARRLVGAGFDVRVWNRTREKAESVTGATVCDSPAEAVAGAAFVLTPLSNRDAIVETMLERGALEAMARDALWIQVATVGVEASGELAALAARAGIAYVDAPLVGTREPAEKGELIVLGSGPDELRERCRPVFDAIGKKTRWVGPAGTGSRLKLVINMWLLSLTEAAAEAIALAEGLGLDPREFLAAVEGGPVDAPYLHLKAEKMLAGELEPSFKLRHAAKDITLVLEAAEQAHVDLAVARAVRDKFTRGIELGHGDDDLAATYLATSARQAA